MTRTTRRKNDVATRSRMSLGDIKQRIRALKKERATAGARAAWSKVAEFNVQLRLYRRQLRRAARRRQK